jgi:hypothetical protein
MNPREAYCTHYRVVIWMHLWCGEAVQNTAERADARITALLRTELRWLKLPYIFPKQQTQRYLSFIFIFLFCPAFLFPVLELPESANSLQRSTWNLWPIFYYYYSRLFCFVFFWTISLLPSLSTLSVATADADHWSAALQPKQQH